MSVHQRLSWIRVDERIYVDALALEVLLRDFAEQLAGEGDFDSEDTLLRLVKAVAAIAPSEREVVV